VNKSPTLKTNTIFASIIFTEAKVIKNVRNQPFYSDGNRRILMELLNVLFRLKLTKNKANPLSTVTKPNIENARSNQLPIWSLLS